MHPNISVLEVCLNGDLQEVISDGYNKIPGDTCIGSFTPHHLDEQLKVIKDTCDDADKLQRALTVDDDGHVMGSDIVQQLKTARDQDLAKVQQFVSIALHYYLLFLLLFFSDHYENSEKQKQNSIKQNH
jgi:hypothetical protein